ncbi:hypothetical protein QY97_00261 [Bacillus thermotolerans]|nr:hypothetical protein QY97_00261 [Bacillus thermotolerans]
MTFYDEDGNEFLLKGYKQMDLNTADRKNLILFLKQNKVF